MKSDPDSGPPQEIELKLYLPGDAAQGLAERLAQTALLARHKASRQFLYNIYHDTANQALRQQQVALRLRRVGSETSPQWLQTLKTGASDASALSRRGEWETPVAGSALELAALKRTPWSKIDPDGSLFDALEPRFLTLFERTSWLLRRPDGSLVEVALDIGQIQANGLQAPICELELELKAGQPAALFQTAREIAGTIAVLPAHLSKAQRGYLLAQDGLDQPQRAQPPRLKASLTRPELAQRLLREMFVQFTANLNALCASDTPEVVHQARVGWRRFKSGLRLFKKMTSVATPSWLALQPLLSGLGALRDLDVALTETLPPLAGPYGMGDAKRAESWQSMTAALTQAAGLQRAAVRQALQQPDTGLCLLAITEWLENLSALEHGGPGQKKMLRDWARGRIVRLQQRLKLAHKNAAGPEQQHRVRILAKRLRYGVEALRDLLPGKLAALCHAQATNLQSRIGATRDVAQASALVATLEVNHDLVEFLRGVALGAAQSCSGIEAGSQPGAGAVP